MKTCKKCKKIKELTSFYKRSDVKRVSFRSNCIECCNIKSREWYKKQTITNRRDKSLNYLYSSAIEEFNSLLSSQNNKCAICNKDITNVAKVDHCHETNKIRGLLCNRCNIGLGYYEILKKEDLLEKMLIYLEKVNI